MAAKSKGSEWSSVVKTKRRELPRHATAHDASGESPTRTFVAYGTVPLDEKDAFGHRDYATAVARLLLNESPPFTLGVFGDWGLGKTTILEEVGRQVTAAGSAFAIFDVWRYEGDALRRQFLRDVASQLKRNGFLRRQYDPERALRDLEVDVPASEQRFVWSWRGALLAVIQAMIVFVAAWLFFHSGYPKKLWGGHKNGSAAPILSLGLGLITLTLGLLNQIFRVDERYITFRRIEEPDRFFKKFEQLLTAVDRPRVVIAIDNLDRCSPGLVDAMLSTIKTYLEPAITESEDRSRAVFVVAADDAAIRRHMVARELESAVDLEITQGRLGTEPTEAQRFARRLEEASRYVDEYLRKFFTSTIRLRALLPEDMRAYAQQQLAPFLKRHLLITRVGLIASDGEAGVAGVTGDANSGDAARQDAIVKDRLIAMIVSALRGNPRRINQFINNLETKLAIITAREASGAIDPPISQDILSIAKLTILEEQWPTHYRLLERDSRLLAQWHSQVSGGDLGDPGLSAFLRTTRDVEPQNLSAILSFKQSPDELELPQLRAFREAVAYGHFDEARTLVSDDVNLPIYRQKLSGFFRQEVDRGYLPEARNILDAALGEDTLEVDNDQKKEMLSYAIADPRFYGELWRMASRPVLESIDLLSSDERQRALEPMLALSSIASNSVDAASEVIQVLAQRVDQLTEASQDRLRGEIAAGPLESHRSLYLPLVQAAPSLLSDQVTRQAWPQLQQRFDVRSPEFEIVTLGFQEGLGIDLISEFLAQLRTAVEALASSPQDAVPTLRSTATALARIDGANEADITALATTLQSIYPQVTSSGDPEVVERVLEVTYELSFFDSPSANDAITWIGTTATANQPAEAATWALAHVKHLRESDFANVLVNGFSQVLMTTLPAAIRSSAAAAVVGLDEGRQSILDAARTLADQGRLADVAPIVDALADRRDELVDHVVALATGLPQEQRETPLQFLLGLQLSAAQWSSVERLITEMLSSTYPAPIEAGLRLVERLKDPRRIVEGVATHLAADDSFDEDEIPVISWTARHWRLLERETQDQLADALVNWLVEGTLPASSGIPGALASFGGDGHQRRRLVETLLSAEKKQEGVDARATILRVVQVLRDDPDLKASKLVQARLAALRKSKDPTDHAVIAALEGR